MVIGHEVKEDGEDGEAIDNMVVENEVKQDTESNFGHRRLGKELLVLALLGFSINGIM